MKLKINYARHYIDKKDLKSVEKSLNSNFLSQGPETIKFEKALNNFLAQNIQVLFQVEQPHYI